MFQEESPKCFEDRTSVKIKKKNFFERCPDIKIPFFIISNPNFSLLFSVITGTV